ncbi:hypothetical protein [Streptococcus pluranimalium]|uniref:hypothetical protein n=1 Tax=Streptococcus pluranimalium TaxID=82348 RepID=UPI003F693489
MTKEFSEAQIQELQLALKDKKNNAHYKSCGTFYLKKYSKKAQKILPLLYCH